MDALPRENWTPYQLQIAANLGTVERDVITGELFVPQFEGQRTNVFIDVDPAGKSAEAFRTEVEEQIMSIKETQWANNPYMNVTKADMQAEVDAMKKRGEAPTDKDGNPMGYDQAVDYWYNQRFGTGEDKIKIQEVEDIADALVGGGENAFVRTAEGLNAWRAMQHGELANFAVVEGQRDYNVAAVNPGHQALKDFLGGGGTLADVTLTSTGETMILDENGNPAANPDGTPTTPDQTRNAVYDWINVNFSWARDLGLEDMIRDAIENNLDDDVMIAQIRQSPQYLAAFPGITDEQGRMRFLDEADYVDQVRQYRNVLRDAGTIGDRLIFDPNTESPLDYAAFMERGISTEELSQRLDTFRNLNNASSGVRAAFKAYANMDVPVEMLYQAVVDPKAATDLVSEYNQNVLDANYSYPEQLANWTDAIREQTLEQLTSLETQGVLPEGAMNRINALSGDEQQALVEALYIGDVTENDPLLEFDELAEAYQFAVIGGAASEQGLVAPSLERIRAIREAGINRAQALKAYGMYSGQKGLINAMLSRTNVQGQGMSAFTQSDFEEAVFLNQAAETDLLTRARQSEQALGRAGGGFATSMQGNRLRQTGRSGSGAAY
ncbi:MAG: hypothetical protein CL440_06850 [Acidimicrobiaceae bacterium]|nr:hypothetical protein [Acidimicrobiaceae bacterium]|tara:strand:- start:7029 stop:8858 length:1830 start_codon:yes stop_codon:yes gene_type:complete